MTQILTSVLKEVDTSEYVADDLLQYLIIFVIRVKMEEDSDLSPERPAHQLVLYGTNHFD